MRTPQEYRLEINQKSKTFKNLLDEMVNSYPLYKLNQNIDSYRKTYERDRENLEKLKANFFLLFNSLKNDSTTLTNFVKEKNKIIEKLNSENEKLVQKLNTLENQDNAASGELESRIKNYYIKLLQNFILFGSALALLIKYLHFLNKKV
tara:strand:+ start:43 stop:489 length:447 start_codon:yes stop_codon:yes gene_type:complete